MATTEAAQKRPRSVPVPHAAEARHAPDVPVAPEVEARVRSLLRPPYRMIVQGEPDEGYLAAATELPGCVSAGDTPEDAIAMLRDAMALWLTVAVEHGQPIPDPLPMVAAALGDESA